MYRPGTMTPDELRKWLRERIKAAGPLKVTAGQLGVSVPHLSNVLNGTTKPTAKLAEHFGFEEINLYRLKDTKPGTLQEQYEKQRQEHREQNPIITKAELQAADVIRAEQQRQRELEAERLAAEKAEAHRLEVVAKALGNKPSSDH